MVCLSANSCSSNTTPATVSQRASSRATTKGEGTHRRTKGQLLERAARRLGPQEVDAADLKGQPDAVADEVLPLGVRQADGVDEGVEEAGAAPEQLEDGDAARAHGEGEELDEEGCQRIVSEHVDRLVGEGWEDALYVSALYPML